MLILKGNDAEIDISLEGNVGAVGVKDNKYAVNLPKIICSDKYMAEAIQRQVNTYVTTLSNEMLGLKK